MRRSACRDRLPALAIAMWAATFPSVSHALLQSCTVSATSLPFGVYNPANASALNATGTVTVTCQVLLVGLFASWTLTMSPGGSASYNPRRLSTGAATLDYNIYTSAAYTTIWGDGSGGTGTVSDAMTLVVGSNSSNYTMYGRIPALQDARAGAYSDSIVVTVNYRQRRGGGRRPHICTNAPDMRCL